MKNSFDVLQQLDAQGVLRHDHYWDLLLNYVSLGDIEHMLPTGTGELEWKQPRPLTEDHVIEDMRHYMELAWQRVIDHNGLGAHDSLARYRVWLWILDQYDLLGVMETVTYWPYGAQQLKMIADNYGFAISTHPYVRRMIEGLPCEEDCDRGCLKGMPGEE